MNDYLRFLALVFFMCVSWLCVHNTGVKGNEFLLMFMAHYIAQCVSLIIMNIKTSGEN